MTQNHKCRFMGAFRVFSRIRTLVRRGCQGRKLLLLWVKVNVEGKDGKEEIRTICSGISTDNGICFIADMFRFLF